MLLALDIGNSSISAGVFSLDEVTDTYTPVCRFKISAKFMTSDEYVISIHQFLDFYGV